MGSRVGIYGRTRQRDPSIQPPSLRCGLRGVRRRHHAGVHRARVRGGVDARRAARCSTTGAQDAVRCSRATPSTAIPRCRARCSSMPALASSTWRCRQRAWRSCAPPGLAGLDAAVIRPGLQRDLARRWQLIERGPRARPRLLGRPAGGPHGRAAGGPPSPRGRGWRRGIWRVRMESVGAELGDVPRAATPPAGDRARPGAVLLHLPPRLHRLLAGVLPELYRIRCRVAIAQDLLRRDALERGRHRRLAGLSRHRWTSAASSRM